MFYGKINELDIANDPGFRVSVFVSGCRNHCKGCFNPETWDFDYGEPFYTETIDKIYKAMKPNYIDGLTILGGDPFEIENRLDVARLCKIMKAVYPTKTIWVYTGYKYEDLKDLPVMTYIDVLVDGPYIENLKDLSLRFRGSSNQRLIDVPASRATGDIRLWR